MLWLIAFDGEMFEWHSAGLMPGGAEGESDCFKRDEQEEGSDGFLWSARKALRSNLETPWG